jgi:hypothetical protein
MDQQVHISYLGLVRNVIGCREEYIEVLHGSTVGQLLRLLVDKQGIHFNSLLPLAMSRIDPISSRVDS